MDSREYDVLAERSQKGDARALALLYRTLAPALLDYLEGVFRDRADAEDVLHDTFLRLFEGRGRYQGRGRFRQWLFTVATHLAVDRLRRRRRQSELSLRALEALAPRPEASPSEDVTYRDLLHTIESALSDLPPAYAMAFHLRVRQGFSYSEIAAICKEPEGTLRSRVHRALGQIRAALDVQNLGDPDSPRKKKENRR